MKIVDANDLVDAGRDLKTPFCLLAHRQGAGQSEIRFMSILRLLPARRIVALAEIDGQSFLVKVFLGKSANKYVCRERAGVLAFVEAGVDTPELLWEGKSGDARVLVFRYLSDAVNLGERWVKSRETGERIRILEKVVKVLARLHDHGVVQNDIHLDNFLLSEGKIFAIDGGAVERKGKESLTEAISLKNFAVFLAQFYPRYDALIGEVLDRYGSYRGWEASETRAKYFRQEVKRSREIRKRHYLNKSFRECTRFMCQSSFFRFEVCERRAYSSELADLMENTDRFIEAGKLLKDGNSSTVALVTLSDRALVVKRYNTKSFWHGLRRTFRKSRAWHAWGNAHLMEFLGLPALRPVAMIENRLGPIRVKAYLIAEFIEGPDALELLTKLKHPDGEAESLVKLLQDLSEVQVSHGDLKATNFLMTQQGPVMIDLDGMKEHRNRKSFERTFGQDLNRFMDNWRDHPHLKAQFSRLLGDLSARFRVNL